MCAYGICRGVAFWTAAGFLAFVSARVSLAEESRQQPAPVVATSGDKSSEAKSASQLVIAALKSEAAGNLDQRAAQLRDALAADPNCAPAHWHLGQVLIDGQWRSVAGGAEANRHAAHLEKYCKLREAMSPTVADHLRLAHYCREVGLADQERLHLATVLQFDRNNKEANLRLRTPRHPIDPKETARRAAALADAKRKEVAAEASWKVLVTRLRDDFVSDDTQRRVLARTQFMAIRDVEAIPALESMVSGSSQEAAQLVVSMLEQMPSESATVSLAKHAVLSQWPEVRKQAALALKPRDMYAYMPKMLAAMSTPVEVRFDLFSRYGGSVGHRLELFQEGPMYDSLRVSAATYTPPAPIKPPPGVVLLPPGGHLSPADKGIPRANLIVKTNRPPLERAAKEGASVGSQIAQRNEKAQALNERIAYVLTTITGSNLPAVPTKWWNWWYDYNEIYYPEDKPVYETTNYATQPYASFGMTPVRYTSCFIAGTPVWTQSGPIPIEKLLVGESVLSQDAVTGELSYRPIVATTIRPPSPMRAIHLDGEEILVTRGHPFWVSGAGWRMAKELKQGDVLHTARGACPIESIDERSNYTAYNLIVAGFDTYFVGKNQVLVHDNNIRGATPTIVPGLTR